MLHCKARSALTAPPTKKNDKINKQSIPPVTLQSLDSKDKVRLTHRPENQLAIHCKWPRAYDYLGGGTKVTFKILFTLSLGPSTHIHHPSQIPAISVVHLDFPKQGHPTRPFPCFRSQLQTFTPFPNKRDLVHKIKPNH